MNIYTFKTAGPCVSSWLLEQQSWWWEKKHFIFHLQWFFVVKSMYICMCCVCAGICSVEHCTNPQTCVLFEDQKSCQCAPGYYSDKCDKSRLFIAGLDSLPSIVFCPNFSICLLLKQTCMNLFLHVQWIDIDQKKRLTQRLPQMGRSEEDVAIFSLSLL